MLGAPARKYRKNRQPVKDAAVPAGVPLVLVSASYDPGGQSVTLQFERPIDVSGFDGSALVLSDADFNGRSFSGTNGTEMLDDSTVQIFLGVLGDPTGPGVTLTVSADSGIVAVDDGGTWAGVSGLVLPFNE